MLNKYVNDKIIIDAVTPPLTSAVTLTVRDGTVEVSSEDVKLALADADCTPASVYSLTLPSSLQAVGSNAFWGFSHLQKVVIPEGTVHLGDGCFCSCRTLEYVDLPTTLQSIGDSSFAHTALRKVQLPAGLKSIGVRAFAHTLISEIDIPDGITGIAEGAFEACYRLSQVCLPESIISIGDNSFAYCGSLADIRLPEGLQSLGDSSFACADSLEHINIPDGITIIPPRCFSECRRLDSITLPDGIKFIGNQAFRDTPLRSINLPDTLEQIGEVAFAGSQLEEIAIPEGVVDIPYAAFQGCYFLKEAHLPTTTEKIGNMAFDNCVKLSSVDLPDGLRSVGDGAFAFTNLSIVDLPSTVTDIGDDAFAGLSGKTQVIAAADNPRFKTVNGNLLSKDGTRLFHACADSDGVLAIPDGVKFIINRPLNIRGGIELRIPATLLDINAINLTQASGLKTIRCQVLQGRQDNLVQTLSDIVLHARDMGNEVSFTVIADSWRYGDMPAEVKPMLLRGYLLRLHTGEEIPAAVNTEYRRLIRRYWLRRLWNDPSLRLLLADSGLLPLDFCTEVIDTAVADGDDALLEKLLEYRSKTFSRASIAAAERKRSAASMAGAN